MTLQVKDYTDVKCAALGPRALGGALPEVRMLNIDGCLANLAGISAVVPFTHAEDGYMS